MKTPVPSKGIQIYVSKFTIFRQANTSCLQVYDKNKKVRYIVIKLKSTGAGKKDINIFHVSRLLSPLSFKYYLG